MYIKKTILSAILIFCVSLSFGQKSYKISSPDQNLFVTVANSADGTFTYDLIYKGKAVVKPSTLGFVFSKPKARLDKFSIVSVDSSVTDVSWTPVWGEVKHIRNNYKELIVRLKDKANSGIFMNVTFRLFNDGLGFRYEFPSQEALYHFVVEAENTRFVLSGDHKTFWIPGDYNSNEYRPNTTKLSEIQAYNAITTETNIIVQTRFDSNAVQTPLMMKTADGLYINIHEAGLLNYTAMNLVLDKKTFTFRSQLVPDAVGNMAYLQTPAKTPWRTIIVSDKATEILSSKLILNLNEPSRIKDPSWIKPQKYVGIWWEMHIGKASWDKASGIHGATTQNTRKYIDFAAKYGFDGVLVEGWNVGWEDWFGNWKEDVFDFITPYPDYDVNALSAYAKSKGVKIIMHHETSSSATNYERQLDTALRFMVAHNMNSVKTGYVGKIIPRGENHDGQWMVNHYTRVVEKAATQKVMVDSHEAVRPTGLQRTYPNWLASESARGQEFNAWSRGNLPEHETILPFTRIMGGPMDYTPGVLHTKLNQFDTARTGRIHTTICKQLALYVTLYSPLQLAADLPENYEHFRDAFQFIVDVPVDWDDTRVLSAEPGDYICTARKAKGKDSWFIGGITDENSRDLSLNMDFLDAGSKYEATLYHDAKDADYQTNPEAYTIEKKTISNKTKLDLHMANGGGFAISIKKIVKP